MKVRYWAAGVVASLGMASSGWGSTRRPSMRPNPYANAPYLQGAAAPRVACNCASPGGYTVAEPTATYAAPVENYAPPAMEMGGAPRCSPPKAPRVMAAIRCRPIQDTRPAVVIRAVATPAAG